MRTTRRCFLSQLGTGLGAAALAPKLGALETKAVPIPVFKPGEYEKINSQTRQFHLSVTVDDILYEGLRENNRPMPPNPDAITMRAEAMADLWKEAGVTDVWLNPYSYGLFPEPERFEAAVRRALEYGYRVHFITVPVGHPGANFAPEIAKRWKPYEHFHGSTGWGVSVHEGCAEDCVKSVRTIADTYGPCNVFLDDDFRFAVQPPDVGGCICAECRADFMQKSGFSVSRWDALLADLRAGRDTKDIRLWLDYFCDRMTKVFRDSQAIAPEVDLGIMIMGMGSEKAGLRLDDYRDALVRVGEWMFTNQQYDSTKNKTIELFSSLLHRRFVPGGRAFSETTIIQELSAENYVSKLSVSTLSDVCNTMYMCPIPASYWGLIAPRMNRERDYHNRIVGLKAKGPFKHFWGLADRYCPGYNAYSLFLALGVPFEVCDEIPADGWAFLGDYSAFEMERGELASKGAQCVARVNSDTGRFIRVPETFEELFKFRKTLLPAFQEQGVPYIEEETPAALSWYPEANAMYIWNVEKVDKVVTLRVGSKTFSTTIKALDSAMVVNDGEGMRLV